MVFTMKVVFVGGCYGIVGVYQSRASSAFVGWRHTIPTQSNGLYSQTVQITWVYAVLPD